MSPTVQPTPSDADHAQQLITKAEQEIPKALEHWEMPLSQYTYYYRAVWYATWDALIHYPDDPRVPMWKWKMTYYAAMAGDGDVASDIYMALVTESLNKQLIAVESLPNWFQSGEVETVYYYPHFELAVSPVTIPEKSSAFIVQLGAKDSPGNMVFLIVEEQNLYTTYLIYDGFNGFIPTVSNYVNYSLKDLTNDEVDEVLIKNWYGGHVGTSTIQIFDISTLPPQMLSFGTAKENEVHVWEGSLGEFVTQDGKIQLPISEKLGQCDVYVTRYFEWNGSHFEVKGVDLSFLHGGYAPLDYCGLPAVGYAEDFVDTQYAIQLIDRVLQTYSSEVGENGNLLDEIRIRKDLVYLFAGQPDEALSIIQDVAQNPIAENGIWAKPAKNFLKTYRSMADIYRACSALTACDPSRTGMVDGQETCLMINPCHSDALAYVMEHQITAQSLDALPANLKALGVDITSHGWIDLDSDQREELWFTVRPPTRFYEDLWIASGYPNGIQTFWLYNFGGTMPEIKIKQVAPHQFWGQVGDLKKFTWERDAVTQLPYLESEGAWADENTDVVTADLASYRQLQKQLYAGADPAKVYEEMLKIADRYQECPYEVQITVDGGHEDECGNYYYILGFAAELSGEKEMALQMYQKVLAAYPNHPMTLLAKEKMDGSVK
jgi:tetratricopeptide (TPR) repeat protein